MLANDQVRVAESEDAKRISVHKLETVASKYGLKISTSKTKTQTFKGRGPVGSKTVINNNNIEQIHTVNYLFRKRMKNILLSKF